MKIFEVFKMSLSSLKANKLRSSLTMLGIVVGIFSIISISTVISMLQASIEDGVSSLGKNVFQIQKWPIVQMSRAERMKLVRNRKDITLEEFFRLKENYKKAKKELKKYYKIKLYAKKLNTDIYFYSLEKCFDKYFEDIREFKRNKTVRFFEKNKKFLKIK